MKNRFITFSTSLLLSGCLLSVVHAEENMGGEKVSRLMQDATSISNETKTYEDYWEVRTKPLCEATLKSADITLTTDGRLSSGKLTFRLTSDVEFKAMPRVLLTSNKYFYPTLEGRGTNFAFELSYELPHQLRRLLKHDSAFIVSYTPKESEYEYRALFPTRQLADIVQTLEKSCY